MVPAHGVTTIFYLLEKARDAAFAREASNVSLAFSTSLRSTPTSCGGRSRSPGLTSRMPSAPRLRRPVRATRW